MKKNIENIFLFLLTIIISALAAYFYQLEAIRIAGIIIIVTAGCGSVWFGIEKSSQEGSYLFDNEEHFGRFMVVYLIALQMIGISAGSVLLMISVILQRSDSITFFIYFIGGLVGITVFSYVDKSFKIWLPLLVSLSVQMVCLSP